MTNLDAEQRSNEYELQNFAKSNATFNQVLTHVMTELGANYTGSAKNMSD